VEDSSPETEQTILNHGPMRIAYAADRTCNLKCRSCRIDFERGNGRGFNLYLDCIKNNDVSELEMLGSGEVFFCKDTLNFLRIFKKDQYPTIKSIFLITNGTLLSKEMWESLGESRDIVKEISVSVDAYSEEAYSKIRGNNFKALVENLNFISDLKRQGRIYFFGLNFVIQSLNVSEIYNFCSWAKDLGVNFLCVTRILNWGHLRPNDPIFVKEDEPTYIAQLSLFKKFIEENPSIKVITNVFSDNNNL
jgi:MoaA/NifB/PqqE/SkfB family radical SAM enzyme